MKHPAVPPYVTCFRVHMWDGAIAEMAMRARACCESGDFVVGADETRSEIAVEPFRKMALTSDFSAYGLPSIPAHNALWWNADYGLYAARRQLPGYDYYVMLEYDVYLHCDVGRIVAQCAEQGIDFVAHDIRRIAAGEHWSFDSVKEMTQDAWWAFIPFIIVSGRAADALLQSRQSLAERFAQGRMTAWPYCEPFLPTAAQQAQLSWRSLGHFTGVDLHRHRPFLSTRDRRLQTSGLIAHPVLAGRRFVDAFLAYEYPRSRAMQDGPLREELQTEDFATLHAALGNQVGIAPRQDGAPHFVFRAWTDFARDKPATQSSLSDWSKGVSPTEDAGFAVTGPLPDDYAFHTSGEDEPWWQVDLLEESRLECVEILNRFGPAGTRFREFRVDGSPDGIQWRTLYTKSDQAEVSDDPDRPARFMLDRPVSVRHVRITQLGHGILHLRRIRLLGFPPDRAGVQALPPAPTLVRLELMLAGPGDSELFTATLASIIHHRVFGRRTDSYDVDALAFLAAGVEFSLYATERMSDARRFADAAALHGFAAECAPSDGLILEFGVELGVSINRLATLLPGRRIVGFDSFRGLPELWRPGFGQGMFARSAPPDVRDNVELVTGWFDRTLPAFVASHHGQRVALLHIDCDLYSSTRTVFDFLADGIVRDTIVVFDEYFNYPGWRLHEFKAFQELRERRKLTYEYIALVPSHQQVAIRITGGG